MNEQGNKGALCFTLATSHTPLRFPISSLKHPKVASMRLFTHFIFLCLNRMISNGYSILAGLVELLCATLLAWGTAGKESPASLLFCWWLTWWQQISRGIPGLPWVAAAVGMVLQGSRTWVSCGWAVVVLQGEFSQSMWAGWGESGNVVDTDGWFAHSDHWKTLSSLLRGRGAG